MDEPASTRSSAAPPIGQPSPSGGGRRGLAFPLFLVFAAAVYFVFVGYRLAYPTGYAAGDDRSRGFLTRCREICARYGLIPSGDLAKDAEAYLEAARPNKLSGDLQTILADSAFEPAATQAHELVGRLAPEFNLLDAALSRRQLSQLAADRPVIVVFYYGYFCNHCVAQLFGLEKDLHLFHELGAEVIAISADSSQHTLEKFREYGAFHFPVLSDPGNVVAATYGVYAPAAGAEPERLDHGTFVIDRAGKVVWANLGPEPFIDNKTLLFALARARGDESNELGMKNRE